MWRLVSEWNRAALAVLMILSGLVSDVRSQDAVEIGPALTSPPVTLEPVAYEGTTSQLLVDEVLSTKFSVKMGGRLQYDTTYGTDDGLSDTAVGASFQNGAEFRRVRLFAAGEGFGWLTYKVQVDFANFNAPVAKDIWVGMSLPVGNVKVGHFKEPFSLEQLGSSRYITFIERSTADSMVAARSLGIQLSDQYADGDGSWQLGSFFDDLQHGSGSADGNVANEDSQRRSINARLTRVLVGDTDDELFHIGAAFRHVDAENSIRFRARPEVHDTFRLLGATTGPISDYQQYGIELSALLGSLSIQSEYINTQVNNAADSNLSGYYVMASYFLTGEVRPYSRTLGTFTRVKPLENYVGGDSEGGVGAWQVAFRYSRLSFDDTGLAAAGGTNGTLGQLTNYTLGLNWYWTPNARLMFNWVHSDLDDDVSGNQADLDAFMTRLAIDF